MLKKHLFDGKAPYQTGSMGETLPPSQWIFYSGMSKVG